MLIMAPLERLDADVARMRDVMREASRIVLAGFELTADAHIVWYPERYMDERGAVMCRRVMALLERAESAGVVSGTTGCCRSNNTLSPSPSTAISRR
jgi:hypothetical protein